MPATFRTRTATTLWILILFTLTGITCILDPHETIEKKGPCYDGYDDYLQFLDDDGIHFESLSFNPDTIEIGGDDTEMVIGFTCHADPSLFSFGEFTLSCSSSRLMHPELLDSVGYHNTCEFGRFGNVSLRLAINDSILTEAADIVSVTISCSIDNFISMSVGCVPDFPLIDTAAFRIRWYLNRYV